MSFVEMEGFDVVVAEIAENTQAPHAENDLLDQAVALVASVEVPREGSVVGAVRVEIRVEEIDGTGYRPGR